MKNLKEKLTLYFNSLSDELRSVIAHRKNKPRTPKLKKLCSFVLAFSLLTYTFLGLFGCLEASAADVESSRTLSGIWQFNSSLSNSTGFVTSEPNDIVISFVSNYQQFDSMSLYGSGGLRLSYESGSETSLRVYDPGAFNDSEWRSESYRIIDFGSSLQTVSADFYQWFTSNASQNQSPDVPVLLTGDFVFDANIFPDGIPSMWSQSLNFVSNGVNYTSMANDGGWLEYGSTWVYKHDAGGWLDDSYRYVSLSNNSVPLWFYQWFNSVTSPYTPSPDSSLDGLYFVSNTSIDTSSDITFSRPFISNSEYFNTIYFINAISGDMISYVDANNNQTVVWSENSGWLEPQYSVIFFNTSETISGEFYNIFSNYYTSVTNDSILNLLYNAGLENGRDFGFSEGYDEGYSVGFSDGESSVLGESFMGDFFGGVMDALDALTVFGSISVLDIIQGVLGLFIALWVLKLIAGG